MKSTEIKLVGTILSVPEKRAKALSIHFLIILALSLLGSGCRSEEASLPKEGDIVTWRQNSELVIKAKLGQRRDHIQKSHIFTPKLERYVGQFPVDHVPEKFSSISREELVRLPYPDAAHQLEFSLMLNGKTARATNLGATIDKGLDDPNQVKVKLVNIDPKISEQRNGYPFLNTREKVDYRLKSKNLVANTKFSEHGLECYRFSVTLDSPYKPRLCFGESEHPFVSGFRVYVSEGNKHIRVNSDELIYGGMQVLWHTHKQNLPQVREIDAAIWRFLDSWNVAPNQ
jgi:hypothetical protein